jgi:hypothetical protein
LRARELEWADVEAVLETIDSTEELHAAAADPEKQLVAASVLIHERGLECVVAVLETIDTAREELETELTEARKDLALLTIETEVGPEKLLERMSRASSPTAKKIAIEKLLERFSRASGPTAKKIAIMHLKPGLGPYYHARGLEWADVVPVLETIDSIEELHAAAADPENLLEGMFLAQKITTAKKITIMHLKQVLNPYFHARGLEWADVVAFLETIDSIEELNAAPNDPEWLLERVYYFKLLHLQPLEKEKFTRKFASLRHVRLTRMLSSRPPIEYADVNKAFHAPSTGQKLVQGSRSAKTTTSAVSEYRRGLSPPAIATLAAIGAQPPGQKLVQGSRSAKTAPSAVSEYRRVSRHQQLPPLLPFWSPTTRACCAPTDQLHELAGTEINQA